MYKYQWRGIALMLSVVLLLIGFTTTNAKYVENKQISVNLRVGAYCGEVLDGGFVYQDKADTVHTSYRWNGKISSLVEQTSGKVLYATHHAKISYAVDEESENKNYYGGLMKVTATGNDPNITLHCSNWQANGKTGINTSLTRYLFIVYYCPPSASVTGHENTSFDRLKLYLAGEGSSFNEQHVAVLPPSLDVKSQTSQWVCAIIDLQEILGANSKLDQLRIDLGSAASSGQDSDGNPYLGTPTGKEFYMTSIRFFSSYTSAVTIANILENKYNGFLGESNAFAPEAFVSGSYKQTIDECTFFTFSNGVRTGVS